MKTPRAHRERTFGPRRAVENVPSAQEPHSAALVAPSAVEYLPTPQSVQLISAPIIRWDQLPDGHFEHCTPKKRIKCSNFVIFCEISRKTHSELTEVAPTAAYSPRLHRAHACAPSYSTKKPMLHGTHPVIPVNSAYFPAPQKAHSTLMLAEAYDPTSHSVHVVAFPVENVPARHGLHATDADFE